MNDQLRRIYRRVIVDRIEGELAIGLAENGLLEGAPIVVRHKGLEQPLEEFVGVIFDGTLPFRLWGLPNILDESFVRVYAVDMHVGHKLTFDISLDTIRIELPKGSCGNAVARFFTLFQQHYDANATIAGGRHEAIFDVRDEEG